MMDHREKGFWIYMLRSIIADLDEQVDLDTSLQFLDALADDLEREWFPTRRRGRRARSEMSLCQMILHNAAAGDLRREVADADGKLSDREEYVAQRHGVGRRALQRRMTLRLRKSRY